MTNKNNERSHATVASYVLNNTKRIGFFAFIFLLNFILIITAVVGYSKTEDANFFFLAARGCGNALNFDCCLIVIVMLRKALSFLRSTWLFRIFPFDDTIKLHKLLGYLCFVLSIIHTMGHVGNALVLETYKNFTAVELLFTNPSILKVGLPVGKLVGSAFITGWILAVVLLVLIVGSLSYVRRSGHFEVFFWTHNICYILFWFILILHAPRFWYWFIVPALCFILEKVSEMKIVKALRFGKTYIKEVNLLPSGVTHLVLPRPRHFKYKAGDYIFIQIPDLAPHEWHPFTISSAPEQIDTISVHIRSAGNWTKGVYQLFDAMTSLSVKRGSISVLAPQAGNQGNVNRGFELSPLDGDEEANVVTVEEFEVDQSGINGSVKDSSDYGSDIDEEEMRAYLTIRRVSYKPAEDLPSEDWKRAHDTSTILEEDSEEDSEGDGGREVKVKTKENGKLKGEGNEEERKDENEVKVELDVDGNGEEMANKEEEVVDVGEMKEEGEENNVQGNEKEEVGHAVEEMEKKPAYTNGHRANSDVAELSLGNDIISVTVDIEPASVQLPPDMSYNFDRRKSKPRTRSRVEFDVNTNTSGRIRVHIQGPYGTPSTSIFHSEHAVMIGAGIGVTPYASILQSIMYRHRNILSECPNCSHSWVDLERQKRALRVKKVDFIWMNRNNMAFEWFVDMLLHLENEQSHYSLDRFLDIHLFMTGMKRSDLKNVGLQMALDLVHEKEHRDLLTGLRTKLQSGRPNWEKLFTKIKSEKKGRVSVFFCGSPALGSVIKNHCDDFGFKFHKESF